MAIVIHPGEYMWALMDDRKITPEELANQLDISLKEVYDILDGRTTKMPLSLAGKLEKVFHRSAQSWVNMQTDYNKACQKANSNKENEG